MDDLVVIGCFTNILLCCIVQCALVHKATLFYLLTLILYIKETECKRQLNQQTKIKN